MTRPSDSPSKPRRNERFDVPGAEILSEDTWAEAPAACPNCGAGVEDGRSRCPECGQWLESCARSCPSCASPRCVGGGRTSDAG